MTSGSGGTSGAARRIQWFAVAALAFAAASLFLPAVGALVLSAAAIVLGVIARRQLRRDPSAGSSWVSIAALILGGFVFVSQLVILAIYYLGA